MNDKHIIAVGFAVGSQIAVAHNGLNLSVRYRVTMCT